MELLSLTCIILIRPGESATGRYRPFIADDCAGNLCEPEIEQDISSTRPYGTPQVNVTGISQTVARSGA